jgi:hypothetical protein
MSRALFILALVVAVSGCKKYRLNGDKEILIGEWEWVSSTIEELASTNSTFTATPATAGFSAAVIFEKRNKLQLIKDGEEQSSGRIKFDYFAETSSSNPFFSWEGKFKYKYRSGGEPQEFTLQFYQGSTDMLLMQQFPFSDGNTTHVRYNIFVRR